MKRITTVLALLTLWLGGLAAQGAGLAFRDDTDVARALAAYLMSGKVLVTDGFVYSGNELAEIADYGTRSGSSAGFKNRLVFSIDPGIMGVTGIDIYTPTPGSDPTLLYFLDKVPVFTELGDAFSLGDSLAGKVKLDLSVRPTFVGVNDIAFYAPWDINSLLRILTGWKFPQEGWLSAANGNAWIAAGRFKAGLGEGHFGNTFLNTKAEWYDQVQGAIGDRNFRFTALVGNSASHLYRDEALIQFKTRVDTPATYNAAENSIDPWDPINDHDFVTQMEAVKMFAYSQVEARFWDRFRFGVGQMLMLGGKYPSLTEVLPTNFWHNSYAAGFGNVMLGLSAALVPLDGLLVFGELTVDDFRGTDEGATGKPSQYAWQGGTRYSFKPVDDLIVTAGGEFTYASEWAYTRWQPYLTMYQRHLINGSQGTDWPLGFAYGPDARHLGLFADASLESGAHAEIGYEYLDKGPIYMGLMDANGNPIYYDYDVSTAITNRSTTLAAVEARPRQLSHGLSLKATWPLPYGLEANAAIQYWNHTNFRNVAGDSRQFFLYSAGVRWKY
jgi:hypothetical protein